MTEPGVRTNEHVFASIQSKRHGFTITAATQWILMLRLIQTSNCTLLICVSVYMFVSILLHYTEDNLTPY